MRTKKKLEQITNLIKKITNNIDSCLFFDIKNSKTINMMTFMEDLKMS